MPYAIRLLKQIPVGATQRWASEVKDGSEMKAKAGHLQKTRRRKQFPLDGKTWVHDVAKGMKCGGSGRGRRPEEKSARRTMKEDEKRRRLHERRKKKEERRKKGEGRRKKEEGSPSGRRTKEEHAKEEI